MKTWKDEEVIALFKQVENCKNKNKSLRFAFEAHAQQFKRKPNSIRNYYYKEVDNLLNDKARADRLKLDLEAHKKSHFDFFDIEEEKNMIKEIENFVKDGMSVRSACFKLSNGDLTKMTRLQNKYQNIKKNNVIPFRQKRKVLSESEINSLLLGLVKLIKKNAVEEYLQNDNSSFVQNSIMKKAFCELNEKDSQILRLKSEFERLKRENQELLAKLKSIEKNDSLKKHLKKSQVSKILEN